MIAFEPGKFYSYEYVDEHGRHLWSVNWRCYAVAYRPSVVMGRPQEIPLFQRHGAGQVLMPEHFILDGKVVLKHKWRAQ